MRAFFLASLLLISQSIIASDKHHKQTPTHTHVTSDKKFKQTGKASWYGYPHAGRKTKSGEIFRPLALTAAHNSLKMGTRVKVTNLKNKKSVILKINDTGGFAKYRRIIDLSLGSARRLGITGIGDVMIESI